MFKQWGALFGNRTYMTLWASQLGSLMGDVTYNVAIIVYVYQLTQSSLQVSTLLIFTSLPSLLIASMAGVFLDRWPLKPVLVISDLTRAAIVIAMPFARLPWQIYLLTFCLASVGKFFSPAYSSVVTALLPKEDLQAANSFHTTTRRFVHLVLPSVAAWLLSFWGIKMVVLFNALTYVASALILWLVRLPVTSNREEAPQRPSWAAEWLEGFRWVYGNSMVWSMIVLSLVLGLPVGTNNALVVAFAEQVLKVSPEQFGYLISAMTSGVFLGGIIIGHLKSQFSTRLRAIAAGLFAGGVAFCLFATNTNLFVAFGLRVVMGIGFTMFNIGAFSTIQELTPKPLRGRVFNFYNMVDESAMLLFLGLAGLSADRLGVSFPFLMSGAVTLLACLYTLRIIARKGLAHRPAVPTASGA